MMKTNGRLSNDAHTKQAQPEIHLPRIDRPQSTRRTPPRSFQERPVRPVAGAPSRGGSFGTSPHSVPPRASRNGTSGPQGTYGAHASHASYVGGERVAAARSGGKGGSQPPLWFLRSNIFHNMEPHRRWTAFRALIGIIGVLLAVYLIGVVYYAGHFFPSSTIGTLSVDNMTQQEASAALQRDSDSYVLTVHGDQVSFTLQGKQAGLSIDGDAIASQALRANNAWTWPLAVAFSHDHTDALLATYNCLL